MIELCIKYTKLKIFEVRFMLKNRKISVLFEDCIIEYNDLWFFSKQMNGLFRMNINNGKVEYISSIPGFSFQTERLVVKIIKLNEKIFCIPFKCEHLWIYNIEFNTWESIEIINENEKNKIGYFFQAILYNDCIYMIPTFCDYIVSFRLETYEVHKNFFVDEQLNEKRKNNNDCYFRTDYAIKNNILYLVSCCDCRVMLLDLRTENIMWKNLNGIDYTLSGIVYDGEKFWIAPRNSGEIFTWDGDKVIEKIYSPKLDNCYFAGITNYNGQIAVIGQSECGNIIFDKQHPDGYVKYENYLAYKVLNDNRDLVKVKHNSEIEVYIDFEKKWEGKCCVEVCKLVEHIPCSSIEKESNIFTLDMFLKSLMNKRSYNK